MNITEFLGNTKLFCTLLPEELEVIKKYFVTEYVKANRTVFTEGEPGHALYIIVYGTVNILKELEDKKIKTLAQLGEGDLFGELALIDGNVRSAGVKTVRDSSLLVFHREKLNELIAEAPYTAFKIIMQIAKILSNRLRDTNDQVVDIINFHLAAKEQGKV